MNQMKSKTKEDKIECDCCGRILTKEQIAFENNYNEEICDCQLFEDLNQILKTFKDDSIYTGRVIKFEIKNRLEWMKKNTKK